MIDDIRGMMDEEVKQLAVMVLLNAFTMTSSGMVNKHLEAGEGLDTDLLLMKMGEMAEVYPGTITHTAMSVDLNIWSRRCEVRASVGHTDAPRLSKSLMQRCALVGRGCL